MRGEEEGQAGGRKAKNRERQRRHLLKRKGEREAKRKAQRGDKGQVEEDMKAKRRKEGSKHKNNFNW